MPEYPEIELRHHYDDELDEIRTSMVEMGTLVHANIQKATVVITGNRLDEIKRSGDLAVNLVKVLARTDGLPADPILQTRLTQLAEASARTFQLGIEAIATMDPEIGVAAEAEDETVDNLTSDLYKAATARQDDIGLDASVALFRIGRFFERIADYGINIAQHVTFIVTARFPEEE